VDIARGSVKVHKYDSLGYLYPKSLELWSIKNTKSPYEYTPRSGKYIWCKCESYKHEDHYGSVNNIMVADFRCPDCVREQKDSIMASTLKQVLRYEYSHTKWEYDAGFKIDNNISRYDIYVPELDNLLIECQSEYHDSEEQIEVDRLKKQFAIDNGYDYIAIDKRDFTVLEILRFFIPRIDKIPDYVQINKNTSKNWNTESAQNLLNNGHTYKETANILETTTQAIRRGVGNKILIKPNNYQVEGKNIACLTIDGTLVKTYNTLKSAYEELGGTNGTSISSCLTKKPRKDRKKGKVKETAFGFKWMYLVDYENMIKDQNNKPP